MKKLAALVLLAALALCGCSVKTQKPDNGKLSVVCTVFPAYDFAQNIAGENADVSLLLPPGSESHSYEPSPADIIAVQNCDLFICVGSQSESWVQGILDSLGSLAPQTLRMCECVPTYNEELVEGMQQEDEEEEEGPELDEHVWTSPKNAALISEAISTRLCSLAPQLADSFSANCETYTEQLDALDKEIADTVNGAKRREIIVADRFPLRYFAEEYSLKYYAAFPGCSADAEPSAATVAFLIDKVKADSVPVVFYIEFSNRALSGAVADATGAKELLFHSCHNVTADELDSGAGYIGLMRQNLANLKEALN